MPSLGFHVKDDNPTDDEVAIFLMMMNDTKGEYYRFIRVSDSETGRVAVGYMNTLPASKIDSDRFYRLDPKTECWRPWKPQKVASRAS